jgi:hypothetical protein
MQRAAAAIHTPPRSLAEDLSRMEMQPQAIRPLVLSQHRARSVENDDAGYTPDVLATLMQQPSARSALEDLSGYDTNSFLGSCESSQHFCSREQAAALRALQTQEPGAFFIRQSSRGPHPYTLEAYLRRVNQHGHLNDIAMWQSIELWPSPSNTSAAIAVTQKGAVPIFGDTLSDLLKALGCTQSALQPSCD